MTNDRINNSINKFAEFLETCRLSKNKVKLTSNSESTPFALCFYIFCLNLIGDKDQLNKFKFDWDDELRRNLTLYKDTRNKSGVKLELDKPYLQLLTFTLSALSIIDTLKNNPLEENTIFVKNIDIKRRLNLFGASKGLPKSGNFAMFYGVLLIHCKEYLNCNVESKIDDWVDYHLKSINRFGFWGSFNSMSHLQFQNGYHQYEIFNYLKIENPLISNAIKNILALADENGHFAPYIGGGSCYDYDAIFILSQCKNTNYYNDVKNFFDSNINKLIQLQNNDGGFCESKQVRPVDYSYFIKFINHVLASKGTARWERLRQMVTLLRPRYNRINTHWSTYSRLWNESSLWDSWFRLMAIAKIDDLINNKSRWNYINYPGLGS